MSVRENKRKKKIFSQTLWNLAGGQETRLHTHTDPSDSQVILSYKILEAKKKPMFPTRFLKVFQGVRNSSFRGNLFF